jgi:RNA polymerase sigma factor (sigma-70 family)
MKKTTGKLTESQRQYAAYNHGLVYDFLRAQGLDDDYYDVVIFRYLHAVQIYDERPELRKYSFKTVAFNNMRSALSHHYEKQGRMKRNATVLSLDTPNRMGLSIVETVSGGALVYEYAEIKDAWEQASSSLTQKQRDAVALRAQGYNNTEIGEALNISARTVSGRINAARKKTRLLAA